MIKALKYINSLPFPVTAKHYVAFGAVSGKLKDGALHSKESWQLLRNEHPRYRIPETREEWLNELTQKKDGQDAELLKRVESFIVFLRKEGVKTLYAVGAGGGVFEYYLKKQMPELRIVASEQTEEGAMRLRRVFTECDEVEVFDALDQSGWKRIGSDPDGIVFIYRNEREFSDDQWRQIFHDMHIAGVPRVFLGLMNMLTILAFVQEKIRNGKFRLKGERVSFAGYLRSRHMFRSYWRDKYNDEEVYFPPLRGVYLKKI